MKKYILYMLFLLALFAVAINDIEAQTPTASIIYSAKAFNTTTNRTDTSSAFGLSYATNAELATSIIGTDSSKFIIYIDGLIAGQWINLTTDSLDFGSATTTTKKGVGTILRGYGKNNITGTELIRIRNVLIPFAAGDSTSATSYSQHILLRN